MAKVCWDPWGRWNTGACTCSTLVSAGDPPPCLGAWTNIDCIFIRPTAFWLYKVTAMMKLGWPHFQYFGACCSVNTVHLVLVLFVHLMKRCWSPHLLVTISLVSTFIGYYWIFLDIERFKDWRHLFISTRSAIRFSFPPSFSGASKAKTCCGVLWGKNLTFSNDLVNHWTRRDGDQVLCVWPRICIWEAYAPWWVESQPVKTQSKLVSWAWGCLVVSRHPWDVIQDRCLACRESLGLPFQPHSLRICPNQIFLPDDEDGDGPPPSPSSDGWWWWGWWWWWWCHFWWWWTEISKVVYNMLFQHVISQQI